MTKPIVLQRRELLKVATALGAAAAVPLNALAAAAPAAPAAKVPAPAGRKTVVIDTDPGQDDAIAILMALGAKRELDVRGLSVVAGNVPLDLTQRNARIVRDWAGRTHDLPVYAGCPRPLTRELITAANVHGRTGLDGVELHEPKAPLAKGHAVQFLIDTLSQAAPQSVSLLALGPLTNVATALIEAPQIRAALREIILMGGAYFERGNITPAAEFNIYVDPQAAEVVFGSGVPVVVLPRDVAVKANITPERVAAIRKIGTQCANYAADIMAAELAYNMKRRGVEEAPMYDPTAAAYLIDPSLFKGRQVNVMVETTGQWTLGETVVDWNGRSGRAVNATWITEVDADRFYQVVANTLHELP